MSEHTYEVHVSLADGLDEETSGFVVGVMGNAVTDLLSSLGHRDAFVSITAPEVQP